MFDIADLFDDAELDCLIRIHKGYSDIKLMIAFPAPHDRSSYFKRGLEHLHANGDFCARRKENVGVEGQARDADVMQRAIKLLRLALRKNFNGDIRWVSDKPPFIFMHKCPLF